METGRISAVAVAVLVLIASFGGAGAEPVPDSSEAVSCNPRLALAWGLILPGGGQFYLRDWSGGIQAVATDALLFEALRRSDATASGMIMFIGAVHVVEGLLAAQECRSRIGGLASRVSARTTRNSDGRVRQGDPVMMALSLQLSHRSH